MVAPLLFLIATTSPWASTNGASSLRPLDLVKGAVDDNGWPVNPNWYYHIAHPNALPDALALCNKIPTQRKYGFFPQWMKGSLGTPPCTSQDVGFDNLVSIPVASQGSISIPLPICNVGVAFKIGRSPWDAFHGHVNWLQPVTFTGFAWYESLSNNPFDHDYDIDLTTPGEPAMTVGSKNVTMSGGATTQKALHMEFDSLETVSGYESPWWREFRKVTTSSNAAGAKALVDGHYAIASGVLGLDAEHTAGTELHPVWALAIDQQSEGTRNPKDDRWSFFIRNWGDEGFCSNQQWVSARLKLKLRIPWWEGATGVQVSLNVQKTPSAGQPEIAIAPKKGIRIAVALPSGIKRQWAAGEIRIRWTGAPQRTSPPTGGHLARIKDDEVPELDEYLSRAFRNAPKPTAPYANVPRGGRARPHVVPFSNAPGAPIAPVVAEPVPDPSRRVLVRQALQQACQMTRLPLIPKALWKLLCAFLG